MNKTSGSIGNIIVSPQYCTNHIAQGRKNNIDRECMWALEYFQHNSCHEDNFFFKIEVDTNGPVRNIFWADSLSRLAYMMFGGVVVFDVTYKANIFNMPFAPFTGVDHRR